METVTAPAHEIVVVNQQDPDIQSALVQQCYDVRIDVFHREQGFSLESEIDVMDPTATHFLLRLVPSLTPIGTIRVFKAPGSSYYTLGRLVVLKAYRKYRFGRELVLALHDFVERDARASGLDGDYVKVISGSQLPVMGFYAKFGYTPEGDVYYDEGQPHQKMFAMLPLSDQ